MTLLKYRTTVIAVLAAMSFPAVDARGESQNPTALELAQMPKFCYWQFQVPRPEGDEYRIHDCGPAMNHYCYGLMYVIRAKAATNKNTRIAALGLAETNIRYTENGIKGYPNCPIRDHVAASKAQVLNLQRIYGGQPSAAK